MCPTFAPHNSKPLFYRVLPSKSSEISLEVFMWIFGSMSPSCPLSLILLKFGEQLCLSDQSALIDVSFWRNSPMKAVPILEHKTKMQTRKHYFQRHFGASNFALSKARLLKHDFPIHGLSGTGDSQRDSRESFAIETPIFKARQANSHESLEFPIHANHATKFTATAKVEKSCVLLAFVSFCLPPRFVTPRLVAWQNSKSPETNRAFRTNRSSKIMTCLTARGRLSNRSDSKSQIGLRPERPIYRESPGPPGPKIAKNCLEKSLFGGLQESPRK